ncbi:uncharacterized protein C11orf24 homolog [Gouania willdenowi]|uniref:Uncharacterized protein n=1 Tax=Gouania willdenowi TaxID=441366 RepID=A0A8C5ECW3_GOUWI|nr:uncharacterized protein C11orf24-like [Gouania willdenowi]XP_028306129.1 uncharacterized protein C11orf24-like [Gouania willdenowi]
MSKYYWMLRRSPSLCCILCLLLLLLANSSQSVTKKVLPDPPDRLLQANCSSSCNESDVPTQKVSKSSSSNGTAATVQEDSTPVPGLNGSNKIVTTQAQTSPNSSSSLTPSVTLNTNSTKAPSTQPSKNPNASIPLTASPTSVPALKPSTHPTSAEAFSKSVPTTAPRSRPSLTAYLNKSHTTATASTVTTPLGSVSTTSKSQATTTREAPKPPSTTDTGRPETTGSSAVQPVHTTTVSPAPASRAADVASTPGDDREPIATVTRVSLVEAAGVALSRQLVDTASLLAVLLFGLLFFLVTVAVFTTQAYESYRRKDYTQVDYLINGMYSDSGV